MQPQLAQSGFPPNWQGVIGFSKFADTHAVVFAKMHSSGECGGSTYDSMSPFGIRSLGYRVARRISSATTRSRSAFVSRSAEISPTCGVYRLIHICETAGFADQNFVNSSRYPSRRTCWRVTVQWTVMSCPSMCLRMRS